ncbi:iron-sulfur cluster assembly accessory protein [Haloimpatiens myeolchijeotgali]
MSAVKMSELAYTQFKSFLDQNNVSQDTVRIFLAGMG